MNEEFLKSTPTDNITRTPQGRFQGSAYVYNSSSEIEEVKFDANPDKPLDPFYYNKPDTNNPPSFTKDEKPRTGVYPIAIVRNTRRAPNHLYESDDAVIAAVNTATEEEPKWETRYFPRNCIDSQVWQNALDILEKTKPIEIIASTDLSLKQFTAQDAEEIFALIDRSRDHLSQFGDDTADKYPTLESVRESIVRPRNLKRLRFAIRNKEEQLVGSINITPDENNPEQAEIGYYLGAEFQRQGYMGRAVQALTSYGFQTLNYKTIYGNVAEKNIASGNVLLKAGYKETGRDDGKIRYSKDKKQNSSHLNTFDFENKTQPVSFVENTKVATGVECDVYAFDGDGSKDLGVIRIDAGHKTPLQRVLKGDRTIEGYISGKGKLVITKPDDTQEEHPVDDDSQKPFKITVAIGERMQWQADKDSPLVAYEICFPPYAEGRYENIE